MVRINIHDAKTHLSRWLKRVESGETIQICRNNVPIAEIRPVAAPVEKKRRPIGLAKGEFVVGPEFFEPMSDDELDLWEGKGS